MAMNDAQKASYLNALKDATNVLDKIDYIYLSSGAYTFGGTPATITWVAATSATDPDTDGQLTISANIDFEMPADRDVVGVAIWSSAAGTPSQVTAAVKTQIFTTIPMQTDEILRITALTYTVE
jgi:uncharacterized protein YuzE